MKTFKIGQLVYFYEQTGPYMGRIQAAKITAATKNLANGQISYELDVPGFFFNCKKTLTGDFLYSKKKVIEDEYKEELVYNSLQTKLNETSELLNKVLSECKPVDKDVAISSITLGNITSCVKISANDIYVNDRNLVAELDDLKKDVDKIKKTIKPKTKKAVKEEKK